MEEETKPSARLDFCLRLARGYATIVRRMDAVLGGHHGLSFSDFMLLLNLSRAPGGRLRRVDLADRLGLTASGVTRSLLPLEKTGWVARQSDPRDARIGYAVITVDGHTLLDNALKTAGEVAEELLAAADADQLEALGTVLAPIAGPVR